MQAILCTEYGSHDELILSDVPDPIPGPGQVLIDVHAASLNFPDLLVIRGEYQFRPEPPFVPGAEAAGVIAALGEGVTAFFVGQRVTSFGVAGAFAEQRVADVAMVIPIPDEIAFATAAAMTMSYGTAYHALVQRGQLRSDETLLVLGAAGGVGSTAVEIGKVLGATVIAAASSDEKLAFCDSIGADHTINYTTEDLRSRVKELTDGHGVDVIYDPVGGDLAEPAFRSIAWGGRYLVIGFAAGEVPAIPLNLPLLKVASIVGVFLGSFTQEQPQVAAANIEEISRMIVAGDLNPPITETFPLERVIDAFELMASRRAMGKVVLQVLDGR
ncbi:MAG: NADPH:quinone oxidoreductase family protein [Acidimicrobiia bacterium]|nr:MAG: NADPH:quinone oxidoreductase family protein [Acidimicrobiia bacterium]